MRSQKRVRGNQPIDSRTRTTTSTRFDLKFFRVLSKIDTLKLFIVLFFTRNVSTVIFFEGGQDLSRLQNTKTSHILVITCSRHCDTLTKTRSRMTTAITFSRQNDAGSRASTTYYSENLVLVVVLVLEPKALTATAV